MVGQQHCQGYIERGGTHTEREREREAARATESQERERGHTAGPRTRKKYWEPYTLVYRVPPEIAYSTFGETIPVVEKNLGAEKTLGTCMYGTTVQKSKLYMENFIPYRKTFIYTSHHNNYSQQIGIA